MSMRKFFRAQRDEDYSQIQYLTAKCTRLAHDIAVLERESLVSRERERKLRNDLDTVTSRLVHQEQVNMELRTKQEQLSSRNQQQQEHIVLLVEESSWAAEELQQVSAELLCLQSSEVKLERLVEEMHAEAQHRAEQTESLQAELHSRTEELEKLQGVNRALTEELRDLNRAHHKEVRALQQENEGSLRKLQETAEQCEWLCQQQRNWMCCVKRFKDCLMEEREALLQQVNMLEKNAEKLKTRSQRGSPTPSQCCPLQDTDHCDSMTLWDSEQVAELESRGQKSNMAYEELFHQAVSPIDGHQKPP